MSRRSLIVEADGGSRGNPGVGGYGALVRDPATGRVLAERAAPLGKVSNNVAEYEGLIAGLRAAQRVAPGSDIEVRMDSKLVVEQMSGRWKIKHEDMRRLALVARDVAAEVSEAGGSVTYVWIPRAANAAADALSNDGMDGETIERDLVDVEDEGADGGLDLEAASETAGHAAGEGEDLGGESEVDVALTPQTGRGEPTRVVLVRHGVTAFTEQGRLDGRGGEDPSLSDTGRAQAEHAGRLVAHLVGDAPVRVVTSSLARAVQTGAAVAAAVEAEPEVDPAWDEQSFGDWDGAAVRDLLAADAAEFARLRDDADYARPGGESHTELAERVVAAWERVVAAGGTSVVVCHRKPIMVVLAHVLGMSHTAAWRLAAAPGSLTGIEVWPHGEVSVAFTNRH